jgi:hypothetical protein
LNYTGSRKDEAALYQESLRRVPSRRVRELRNMLLRRDEKATRQPILLRSHAEISELSLGDTDQEARVE